MKNIAVIFAGGTGQRMGSKIPKQFLKISGKEIIIHTIEIFENNQNIDEIYIACVSDWIDYLKSIVKKFNLKKVKKIFAGGTTGQDSIFIGLKEVKKNNDNAIVLIHDGVRPLVSEDTIDKCIETCKKYGNAITTTTCYETPIQSDDGKTVSFMPPRSIMYTAQAPQCFYLKDIYEAHIKERKTNPEYKGIVDSCNLMYKNGVNCYIVEGNRGNIKVTTNEDFCYLIGNYNARDYETLINLPKDTRGN